MKHILTRQVHLDFHTSEYIPDVGKHFDRKDFQNALMTGHVNSITVFAKCHHGWCYYPTIHGKMHPNLKFDLTGAMIEAAHKIGVKAPVYITVGWSANDAKNHPEWLVRDKNGIPQGYNFDLHAKDEDPKPFVSWQLLCPIGTYANHVYTLTEEICNRYNGVDGFFYDIVFCNQECYCKSCLEGMIKAGLDPENAEDAKKYNIKKRTEFMKACTQIAKDANPHATLFFNGGANLYEKQWHNYHTHFEIEDLPTTWGGYDKMPLRTKFFHATGKDYLCMTGKFHTSWGEFGGYKTAASLRYECAAMLAFGAKCSVGDQMHPSGAMDIETYHLIGEAYKYVKDIEQYCIDTEETSRLGIWLSGDEKSDEGLVKILLEKQMDFIVVYQNDDLRQCDAIILPDCVTLNTETARKINDFIKNGGGLLFSGESGLEMGKNRFLIEAGIKYLSGPSFDNDYAVIGRDLNSGIVKSPVLFYEAGQIVDAGNTKILAQVKEPYFNRTYGHYCSHRNTPYRIESASHPAAVQNGKVIYLAHKVCKLYYEYGAQFHRDYFYNALERIYKEPILNIEMSSAARVRLARQPKEKRYILHLLYSSPLQRGNAIVIEDMPKILNVNVSIRMDEMVSKVTLYPNTELAFEIDNKYVKFIVPEVQCHAIVILDYHRKQ